MLIDKFLTYLRGERRYSEHTIEAYARDLSQFAEFVVGRITNNDVSDVVTGDLFVPSVVTTDDIRAWIIDLSSKGLSPASINRKTSSLRSFYKYLRKIGVVTTNLFLGIEPRKEPSRLPSFVQETKMTDVLNNLEIGFASDSFAVRRNALLVLLLYTTGLRLAEIRGVRLGDFTNGYSELRVLGKGNKERIVPVIEYTRRRIIEYIYDLKARKFCISPDLSLLLTEKGKPVPRSEIYRIVREELEAAGVLGKRSPHVLRHTFATHMLDGGADIRVIQELLGHSSLAATQVYTHNSIAKLKEAYNSAHPRARKKDEGK